MPLYTEEDVTNALKALVNGEYRSICRAALERYIIDVENQNQEKKVTLVNKYQVLSRNQHLRTESIAPLSWESQSLFS
jgi:hypothetical protein